MRVRALAGAALLTTVTLTGTPAVAAPPAHRPTPPAPAGLRAPADRADVRIGTAVDMTALAEWDENLVPKPAYAALRDTLTLAARQ